MRAQVRCRALLLLIITTSLSTGCAADVVLVDPRTDERAVCRASLGGMNPWSQQEACVGAHTAEGWRRVEPE